jgi:GLTT repeat (6 copies)
MAARRRAMEYRSEQMGGDLPVVHVSVGGRQADGRYRLGRARGVIALGDVATGLVAVGGVAIGLFSVGGVVVGLVALGAVAIGLVTVGAVAIGLFAAGAVAMGLTAVGAVTAGLVGTGSRPPLGATARELGAPDGRREGVRGLGTQAR